MGTIGAAVIGAEQEASVSGQEDVETFRKDSTAMYSCTYRLISDQGCIEMSDLAGAVPGRAEIALRIAIPTLAAVFASAILASLAIIALSGADVRTTLTVADFWKISFPISLLAPCLVCPVLAMHLARPLRDLRRARDELLRVAHRDPLTGLLNRRGFDLAAAQVFADSRRKGQSTAALMCDIDMFKSVNDQYGHEFGDVALKAVAEVIQASVGARPAVLGRQGGEEFAILLPSANFAESAEIAEAVRAACAATRFGSGGVAIRITLSIGIAAQASWAIDPRTLLARADAALYQAKREGRNRVVAASENRKVA
jgi:diguanylate cyclase (GGDEF)-like protein